MSDSTEVLIPTRRTRTLSPNEPLVATYVRDLTPEDFENILSKPPESTPKQSLQSIKHAHHQIARLLASGVDEYRTSLITGHTVSYISRLATDDPLFKDLIRYYSTQTEQIWVDAEARMKDLELAASEEMLRRVTDEPESFSRKDLLELLALTSARRQRAQGIGVQATSGVPSSGISLNIQVVGASTAAAPVTIDQPHIKMELSDEFDDSK